MGLTKSVSVKIDPELKSEGLIIFNSDKYEIKLKKADIWIIHHELGHAYIEENFPRLRRFFRGANVPAKALFDLGKTATWAYIAATGVAGMVPLFSDNYKILPLITYLNIPLFLPSIVEETMATYLGKKKARLEDSELSQMLYS
ncbi:hypothetical protein HY212_03460 [Candidatus Pacearchaeota archaeon]|nr:hypothetical protein [Candidatus Pacearchaeota archaeon]